MPDKNTLLRRLPKVDDLLQTPQIRALEERFSRAETLAAVRLTLTRLREGLLSGEVTEPVQKSDLLNAICDCAQRRAGNSLRAVINATGIVLHTNLGRAVLAHEAAKAVYDAAKGYSNLEYDIEKGERGSRMSHISSLLREIAGCEDAMAVNNNAAAVLLALTAAAKGREVIISRGELVEIGGAFRVPEVMEQSGCILVEVGTTNKTRVSDYARAITEQTGAILKVHSSNFKQIGFTESASLDELCALGRERGLPVIHDLGSGLLAGLDPLQGEPTVAQSVKAGCDVITFSGDKLLGGPQAGIIAGKREYVEMMKKHPLARALRIDKLTLTALEATLKLHRSGGGKIPTVAMLSAQEGALKERAERLCGLISQACGNLCQCTPQAVDGLAGGGSAPGEGLPSFCAAIRPNCSLTALEHKLRVNPPHVIGRLSKGELLLDVRTLLDGEDEIVAAAVAAALEDT